MSIVLGKQRVPVAFFQWALFCSGFAVAFLMSAGGPGVVGPAWIFVILAFLLLALRSRNVRSVPPLPLGVYISMFGGGLVLFGLVLSSLLSMSFDLERLVSVAFSYSLLFALLPLVFLSIGKHAAFSALWGYLVGLVFLAAFSVVIYFGFQLVAEERQWVQFLTNRLTLWDGANRLATHFVVGALVLLFLFERRYGNPYLKAPAALAALVGVGLFFIVILLTGSVAALLIFLLIIPAAILFSGIGSKLKIGALVVSVVLVTVLHIFEALPAAERVSSMLSGGISGATEHGDRITLMKTAFGWIGEAPVFGHGVGSVATRDDFEILPHNTFLLLWLEGGLLAFLGGILFVVGLFVTAVRASGRYRIYLVSVCFVILGYWQVRTHGYQIFIFFPVFLTLLLGVLDRRCSSSRGQRWNVVGQGIGEK